MREGRARSRHESCNRQFKCCAVLKNEYRHDLAGHGHVFHANAGITQLTIDNGSCLFGCEAARLKKQEGDYSIDEFDLDA